MVQRRDLVYLVGRFLFVDGTKNSVIYGKTGYFGLFWPIFLLGDLGKGGANTGIIRTSGTLLQDL